MENRVKSFYGINRRSGGFSGASRTTPGNRDGTVTAEERDAKVMAGKRPSFMLEPSQLYVGDYPPEYGDEKKAKKAPPIETELKALCDKIAREMFQQSARPCPPTAFVLPPSKKEVKKFSEKLFRDVLEFSKDFGKILRKMESYTNSQPYDGSAMIHPVSPHEKRKFAEQLLRAMFSDAEESKKSKRITRPQTAPAKRSTRTPGRVRYTTGPFSHPLWSTPPAPLYLHTGPGQPVLWRGYHSNMPTPQPMPIPTIYAYSY